LAFRWCSNHLLRPRSGGDRPTRHHSPRCPPPHGNSVCASHGPSPFTRSPRRHRVARAEAPSTSPLRASMRLHARVPRLSLSIVGGSGGQGTLRPPKTVVLHLPSPLAPSKETRSRQHDSQPHPILRNYSLFEEFLSVALQAPNSAARDGFSHPRPRWRSPRVPTDVVGVVRGCRDDAQTSNGQRSTYATANLSRRGAQASRATASVCPLIPHSRLVEHGRVHSNESTSPGRRRSRGCIPTGHSTKPTHAQCGRGPRRAR
jgi:hypothetical protein